MAAIPWLKGMNFQIQKCQNMYIFLLFLTDAPHFIIWWLNIIVSNYIALKFIS